jgi:hypothetical protein
MAPKYNINQLPSGKEDEQDEIVHADWVKDSSDFSLIVSISGYAFFIIIIALILPYVQDAFLILVGMIYCFTGHC